MCEHRHACAASGARKSEDNFWELVLTASCTTWSREFDWVTKDRQTYRKTNVQKIWDGVGYAGSKAPTIQPRDSVSL